jgi:hypothetical protein
MSDVPAEENQTPGDKAKPAIKNMALVQCEGFRCLAYRDADTWRDFETGKELPEVLSIVERFTV